MSKLNTKLILNAKPKSKEYRLSDGSGLVLRVRPTGDKSWLYCFRLPGDRRLLQMTLGSLNDVSLKEVRNKLPDLRKLVSEGIDPRTVRAALKTENSQAITMQALFDAWIDFVKLGESMSPIWAKRHGVRWHNHLKKPLGMLLVKDVGRAHLAAALDAMIRKGIKEETRKALTTLNLMMDYALTRHFIEQNPARMLKPKDFSATANRPHDRVLSLVELRQLWQALDQTSERDDSNVNMAAVTVVAIKLLILTGARRGEVAAMRWSELNLELGTWILPASRTKNRQPHTIYLSELAISLIKNLRPITGHSLFTFDTGKGTEKRHIQPDSLNRAIDRLRKSEKLSLPEFQPFTIHDFRRSAATAWGEYLKTNPHVIELMLNHKPHNKLVATYQRAIYPEEQKAAWHAWGRIVEHQVAQDPYNVVPINRNKVQIIIP